MVVKTSKIGIKIVYLTKTSLRSYTEAITKKTIISQIILNKKKWFKKLVFVLTTFMLVIDTSKKDIILDYILYIYYLIYFQKSSNNVEVLIELSSEIYTITLIYTLKLGFQV